jgi:hypothetical protein
MADLGDFFAVRTERRKWYGLEVRVLYGSRVRAGKPDEPVWRVETYWTYDDGRAEVVEILETRFKDAAIRIGRRNAKTLAARFASETKGGPTCSASTK